MSEPKKNSLSERAVAFSVDALLGFKENTNRKSFTSQTCVQDSGNGNQMDQCFAAMSTFGSRGIGMELIDKELWTQFHNLGNEMIITKSGRRTFPALKVHVSGLDLDSSYIIWLDIVPMDQLRYRYVYSSSKWTVAAMEGDVLGSPAYVHPDSPASGRHWMSQPITFDKLKLTNCKNPTSVLQVPLRSMHKYQPRIHIQKAMGARENPYLEVNSSLALTFTFAETQFITVTAYQNQQV
ncbi:T-box transcription factor TBX22-like, partial [Stegodyphus dumicola]|uniref:T-box transcription factor TBX22-like n=1 Tax=Stegodyphus dumicola TaxID=202533 RepID=UPI0015A7E617